MTTWILIAMILVIVGAINWGLVGFFNFNLVSRIFGERTVLTKTIYVLVGIAGVYAIYILTRVMPIAASSR
ncbi:MAG TPA: DUF378 domain-containing protein [Armatimonadota bacterium]